MQTYILLSLLISLLWGTQPLFHKMLLNNMNAATIMIISGAIYTLCLIIFAYLNKSTIENDVNHITKNDIIIISFTTIITVFLTNMIYYYVLKDHKSSIISALIYSCPVFTLIGSYLYTNEKIDNNGLLGIIFIIIGVIFISYSDNTPEYEKYTNVVE